MPEVSVVVPIYNAGKTLDSCIKSIIKNTFQDYELILVNDGSTDNSLEICKKYKQNDKRIIIINKNNEGTIPTRRIGIESAKSNYVTFADADDWVHEKWIDTLYDESIQSGSDITVCNTYRVLGFIKQKNKSWYYNQDKIYNKDEIRKEIAIAYFHGHPFPASLHGKLYKKDLLLNSGKYLDRIRFLGDDMFYNLEMLLKADRIKIINKTLYYYRMGGGTGKYMPHFFNDIINGYDIQKEVIKQFYHDSKQHHLNGISIMLLNMLKSSMYNLLSSDLQEYEIRTIIKGYLSNITIIDSTYNEGAMKFFPIEYLDAIRNKNIHYFYQLGARMYKRKRPKKFIMNLISKLQLT